MQAVTSAGMSVSDDEESMSSTERMEVEPVPGTVQSIVRAGDEEEELEDGRAFTTGCEDRLDAEPTNVVGDAEVVDEDLVMVEAEDDSMTGEEEVESRRVDPASGPTQLVPVNPAGVEGFVLA